MPCMHGITLQISTFTLDFGENSLLKWNSEHKTIITNQQLGIYAFSYVKKIYIFAQQVFLWWYQNLWDAKALALYMET